jgi:hypothetical protein
MHRLTYKNVKIGQAYYADVEQLRKKLRNEGTQYITHLLSEPRLTNHHQLRWGGCPSEYNQLCQVWQL